MSTPKKFKVVLSKKADKQLRKLDKQTFNIITSWIKKNLENCEDPRKKGKGLVGDHSKEWRYRVGDYKILAEINDDKIIIYRIEVGHRREIYN